MLRTIFISVFIIFILGAALTSPFSALLGYIWFALFRPQEWVWFDLAAFRISLVLGCILLAGSILKKSLPNLNHPLSVGIAGFLLTGLIAQSNAVNQAVGWNWLDFFARLTLVCLLLVTLVDTERRLFLTVCTVCSSLGFHTAKTGLASLIGGGVHFSEGLAGAFVDSNGFALAAVMIIPLLLVTAAHIPAGWPFRKAVVWGCRAAVPLTAYMVISTFSRGGLLALVAVVVTYVMFQHRRFKILCILGIAGVLIYTFVPMPQGYEQRVETISTYEDVNETSAISRLHFWAVAWDMAVENPIGVGLFNFGSNYNKYDFSQGQFGTNRAVHNSHLQVLTENGFAGLAIWILMYIIAFRTCFRIRRSCINLPVETPRSIFYKDMSIALIVSMSGFLVGGTFISMSLNDLTWLTFAMVAALDRLHAKALKTSTLSLDQPLYYA
jgi:putative inorganic carbon (hco3(-)) transporter